MSENGKKLGTKEAETRGKTGTEISERNRSETMEKKKIWTETCKERKLKEN
jgi:hypothetical protein